MFGLRPSTFRHLRDSGLSPAVIAQRGGRTRAGAQARLAARLKARGERAVGGAPEVVLWRVRAPPIASVDLLCLTLNNSTVGPMASANAPGSRPRPGHRSLSSPR